MSELPLSPIQMSTESNPQTNNDQIIDEEGEAAKTASFNDEAAASVPNSCKPTLLRPKKKRMDSCLLSGLKIAANVRGKRDVTQSSAMEKLHEKFKADDKLKSPVGSRKVSRKARIRELFTPTSKKKPEDEKAKKKKK